MQKKRTTFLWFFSFIIKIYILVTLNTITQSLPLNEESPGHELFDGCALLGMDKVPYPPFIVQIELELNPQYWKYIPPILPPPLTLSNPCCIFAFITCSNFNISPGKYPPLVDVHIIYTSAFPIF